MISGPPPMIVFFAVLAKLAAMGAALLLTRRNASHRPVAVFLALVTLADVAGLVLAYAPGATTTLPDAPLTGLARGIGHLRQGLYFTWPFAFSWLAIAVFLQKRTEKFLIPLYLLVWATFIFGYPTIGGVQLQRAYLVLELATLLVSTGMLFHFAWRRVSLSLAHVVVILLLFAEFAVLIGAWTKDVFGQWDVARLMYLVTYSVLAVVQGGGYLWKRSS